MSEKKQKIEILRRANAQAQSYIQEIIYESHHVDETVAGMLMRINDSEEIRDTEGKIIERIHWECGCLQKKCGACAMVINGRPRLACDAFLKDLGDTIRVEPLKKFPPVRDLIVDRSIMKENLHQMELWGAEHVSLKDEETETAYEASRCLQCGCCLEVCPNFIAGGSFFGAAAFVPTTRLLTELPQAEQDALKQKYIQHVYAGCGKSLSCSSICPAGIDVEHLLVRSNKMALARRQRKH